MMIHQIVTGDSLGAVKDVLLVSPTLFLFLLLLFFIYPLLSPLNPVARLKT